MVIKVLPFVLLGVVAVSSLANAASNLPPLKAARWVNSPPLTPETLRGKVVLVDFWEYTCVNWIRTAPYVKAWNRDYASLGLAVIGVHAPEFSFAKELDGVKRAIETFGIEYPVVMDNGYAIWQAYANRYWPAKYLVDKDGLHPVLPLRRERLRRNRARDPDAPARDPAGDAAAGADGAGAGQ